MLSQNIKGSSSEVEIMGELVLAYIQLDSREWVGLGPEKIMPHSRSQANKPRCKQIHSKQLRSKKKRGEIIRKNLPFMRHSQVTL